METFKDSLAHSNMIRIIKEKLERLENTPLENKRLANFIAEEISEDVHDLLILCPNK